jgi:hypothetical protein
MRLDRAGRPLVERPQMGGVMVRKGQQPAETVEVAVIRVAGRRAGVGRGGELGLEPAQRACGLLGERGDARPGHARRGRSWLARRPGFLSMRETKGDQSDAALDDQEVDRDLTDPPVLVRPGRKFPVAHPFDTFKESRASPVRPLSEEPNSLADPLRTVRGIIRYGERHSNAYCAVRV